MPFKEGLNPASQDPLSLSMDDSHFINALLDAGLQIVIYEGGHLLRIECMEIKHPIYGDVYCFFFFFYQDVSLR